MKYIEDIGSLGKLNDEVLINVREMATLATEVLGTWVGTITFKYTIDGVTWRTMTDPVASATTMTSNGKNFFNVSLFKEVKLQMTSYTSGTAKVGYIAKEKYGGLGASV